MITLAAWTKFPLRVAASMLALSAIVAVAISPAASPARADGSTTERFSIKLGMPQGYCALDPSHATDATVIARLQQTVAAGEQLARAGVDCAQLEEWRKPLPARVDFDQFMIVTGWKFEGMTYDQRVAIPPRMCQTVRQQTGQAMGEARTSFDGRLPAFLATVKSGDEKLFGVVDEEPAACYVVAAGRKQTAAGKPVSVLNIRATVVIKGRILQFYQTAQTSVGNELHALQRSADTLKRTVQAHLAANM